MGNPVTITPDAQVTITPDQPRGALSRYWEGVQNGMGADNALSPRYQDPNNQRPIADNPLIPGTGVYRDIKARNYAGAAGRVTGPAAALLLALGGSKGAPEAQEFAQSQAAASGLLKESVAPNPTPFPRVTGGADQRAVYPGAPLPATPAEQLLQANTLAQTPKANVPNQGAALANVPTKGAAVQPEPATTPVPAGQLPREAGDPYAGPRTPEMKRLDSTNLQKAGYHENSQTMVVEFRNGRVYEYRGVPKEIYKQFQDSESQGSFLARNIKGRYETNYRGSVLGRKY